MHTGEERSVKRTFLNRNYYGSRDVLFGCLGVFKGQGNETERVFRLIRIISILSNLEIRMEKSKQPERT